MIAGWFLPVLPQAFKISQTQFKYHVVPCRDWLENRGYELKGLKQYLHDYTLISTYPKSA